MLVVFADSQATLKVLDGYCRHMGGNLSQGTIKGDEVACPFHDWRWGGDGKCKLVPYAKRTPRLARTRAWTTDVRGGLLFVWHDHEGNPPQQEVRIPEIPESASDEWTDWRWNSILIEGSNCREIIDNVTDMAHFFYIHFGLPTYFKNVFEGHIASQYLHNVGRPDVNDLGTSYGEAHLDSEASYFGPSFMINWLHNNYGGFKAESILINCHYPVSQDSFVLQWGVIVEKPKGMDEKTTDKLATGVHRRRQQGLPAGRRDLEAQDAHRQPTAGRGGRRRVPDAPLVSAVLRRRRRRHPGNDRPLRDRGRHHRRQREVERRGRREPQGAGRRDRKRPRAALSHDARDQPEVPDVDRLARSMLALHGAHDDDRPRTTARTGESTGILVEGTGFRIGPRPCGRRSRGDAAGPGALSDLRSGVRRLPVLPCVGQRQEAGPGAHVGPVEHRSGAALRVLHRDTRVRR